MTEIEEHIAHLSRAVDDLSQIVARQETEIALLGRRLDMLLQREAARDSEGAAVFADERPPHW